MPSWWRPVLLAVLLGLTAILYALGGRALRIPRDDGSCQEEGGPCQSDAECCSGSCRCIGTGAGCRKCVIV
jgi:hypothetical protein